MNAWVRPTATHVEHRECKLKNSFIWTTYSPWLNFLAIAFDRMIISSSDVIKPDFVNIRSPEKSKTEGKSFSNARALGPMALTYSALFFLASLNSISLFKPRSQNN